jgi:thymidylate kinase
MVTVALIGADGAGKSSVGDALAAELGLPVKTIYMGVNPHRANVALPHTRLVAAIRRIRAVDRSSELSDIPTERRVPASGFGRSLAAARAFVRGWSWLAEMWYRQAVATWHKRRGTIVVFDRHVVLDYAHAPRPPLLARLYPKPDLVVLLDAPAEVLHARKPEGSLERLRRRRDEYLALKEHLAEAVVVDAALPAGEVSAAVAAAVRDAYERAAGR